MSRLLFQAALGLGLVGLLVWWRYRRPRQFYPFAPRARMLRQALLTHTPVRVVYWSKTKHKFIHVTVQPTVLEAGLLSAVDPVDGTQRVFKVARIRELTLCSDPPQTIRPMLGDDAAWLKRWGLPLAFALGIVIFGLIHYHQRPAFDQPPDANAADQEWRRKLAVTLGRPVTNAPVAAAAKPLSNTVTTAWENRRIVESSPAVSNFAHNAVFWTGEESWLSDNIRTQLLDGTRLKDDPSPPRIIETDTVDAYFKRAGDRLQAGDINGAMLDFTRTIILDPSRVEAYTELAGGHILKGDFDKAIANCNRAILAKPYWGRGYFMRGVARQSKNDLAGALADFSKAIELDPNDASAFNGRAWVLRKKGDYAGAISDADKAIELSPNDPDAHDTRGWAKFLNGDRTGALVDCKRAAALGPASASGHCSAGLVLFVQNQFAAALREWNRAIAMSPTLEDDLRPWLAKAAKKNK